MSGQADDAGQAKDAMVWVIAGSDPSGGAGLQMDLRVLHGLKVPVASVVTALTAQSLNRFHSSSVVPLEVLSSQLAALGDSAMPRPRAIKIGMLGSGPAADVLAPVLKDQRAFVVLDPVVKASSGGLLADDMAVQGLLRLLPQVDLVTPNIFEAETLLKRPLRHASELPEAAQALLALGAKNVLIKGGHLATPLVHDYYLGTEGSFWLSSGRHPADVRGTGCALASAIAGHIALGYDLSDSLVLARSYLGKGIRRRGTIGPSFVLGALSGQLTADDLPWLTPDLASAEARPRFPSCGEGPLGFYPVLDRHAWVKRVVDLGATTVQLRIKDLTGDQLTAELAAAIAYCSARHVRLFINDHWQLAASLGAYGVHLGQEDLATCDVAALAATGMRLGLSTHSYAEASRAHALRPSYVALGPIFATTSKQMRFGPQGMARLSTWHRLLPYPLVAIGGLKAQHAAEARLRGASGVACISDVTQADHPDDRVRQWLAALS